MVSNSLLCGHNWTAPAYPHSGAYSVLENKWNVWGGIADMTQNMQSYLPTHSNTCMCAVWKVFKSNAIKLGITAKTNTANIADQDWRTQDNRYQKLRTQARSWTGHMQRRCSRAWFAPVSHHLLPALTYVCVQTPGATCDFQPHVFPLCTAGVRCPHLSEDHMPRRGAICGRIFSWCRHTCVHQDARNCVCAEFQSHACHDSQGMFESQHVSCASQTAWL